MKNLIVFITLLFVFVSVFAFNPKKSRTRYYPLLARRAVYAEFAGASMILGVSYDSRFTEDSRLGYRVGLTYGREFNIPLEINYLVGRRETKNKLDLGVGVNFACSEKGELGDFAFLNIGYRFQPRNGVIFRVGLSPKFPFGNSDSFGADLVIWATSFIPYLSLGYAF